MASKNHSEEPSLWNDEDDSARVGRFFAQMKLKWDSFLADKLGQKDQLSQESQKMKEIAAIMRTFDNGVVEEEEDVDKIWVDSAAFDIVISCIIVLNAFVIGLETDVRRASRERDAGWIVAEVFFLLCFLGEVGLKMYYHTWRWAFNSFSNMLTIFICFMAFIDCTILNPIGVSGVLRMFSMFRIVGISRLYKLIKTIPSIG